jgi:hypothetical protein
MSSPQRVIAIVLMAGQLSACTSWRVETLSPAEVIRVHRPAKVRLEDTDGHREVLYRPEVQGDTVKGRRAVSDPAPNRGLALSQIKQVATRHVSSGRTVGFVLGLGLIVAVVVHAAEYPTLGNLGY